MKKPVAKPPPPPKGGTIAEIEVKKIEHNITKAE
jgi:hypothetical protein